MFDLSWTELLLIAVVAVVFIGPKELPGALRTIGRFAAKARSMAREFQSNVDEMIRESELDEVRKQVQRVQSGEYARELERSIDPKGEIATALEPPQVSSAGEPPPPAPAPSEPPPPEPPREAEPEGAGKRPEPGTGV